MKMRLFARPKKDSRAQQGVTLLIDCGQARKRTKGLPVGFVSERGGPRLTGISRDFIHGGDHVNCHGLHDRRRFF